MTDYPYGYLDVHIPNDVHATISKLIARGKHSV